MGITDRIYSKIEKHAVKISFALALILASVVTLGACRRADEASPAELQAHLAQEVLRFHVLANSDAGADQEQKLAVRDAAIDYMERNMPDVSDSGEAKEWVRSHTDEIEEVSREAAAAAGEDYPVSAAVTTCWFPEKSYGDVTFPEGNYEALRIEIGAARGHNWWCVLYPSLCFLDTAHAVVPEEGKEKLKNVLTEEEYSRITAETEFEIGWFFWQR